MYEGPNEMKAARIHGFGSPDVIAIDEVPLPTPNEGEIFGASGSRRSGALGCAYSGWSAQAEFAIAIDSGVGFVRRGRSDGSGSYEVQGGPRGLRGYRRSILRRIRGVRSGVSEHDRSKAQIA